MLHEEATRILIVGGESAIDYLNLRAKYHLLPHSIDVTDRLTGDLSPGSLDYVVLFGQPANITEVPGWSQAWRDSLDRINTSQCRDDQIEVTSSEGGSDSAYVSGCSGWSQLTSYLY